MRKKTIPHVRREIWIPSDLAEDLDKLLHNPLQQRRRYGALSLLCTQMLMNWVEQQRNQVPAAQVGPLPLLPSQTSQTKEPEVVW